MFKAICDVCSASNLADFLRAIPVERVGVLGWHPVLDLSYIMYMRNFSQLALKLYLDLTLG